MKRMKTLRDDAWKGPKLTGDDLSPYSESFEYSVLKGIELELLECGVVSVVTGWPDGWVEGMVVDSNLLCMMLTLEVEGSECVEARARLWLGEDLFLIFTGSSGRYDGVHKSPCEVHRFDINDPRCFKQVFELLGAG